MPNIFDLSSFLLSTKQDFYIESVIDHNSNTFLNYSGFQGMKDKKNV